MVLPIIAQVGIPVLVKGLAEGLSQIKSPLAQGASAALSQLGEAMGMGLFRILSWANFIVIWKNYRKLNPASAAILYLRSMKV